MNPYPCFPQPSFIAFHKIHNFFQSNMKPLKGMDFPMFLLKLTHWLLYHFLANSLYKAATKFNNSPIKTSHNFPLHQTLTKPNLKNRESQTLVCDIHNCLLRSKCFFPFFMLVSFEAGSIFRALFLLLSYPFLCVSSHETKMRVMIFITFCGLRLKDMETVSKAVLPKFYLEDLNLQAYEVLSSVGIKVVVTSVPKVMVESFLKEYLNVDSVVGTELQTVGQYFTGLVKTGLVVKHRAVKKLFGNKCPDIGVGRSTNLDDNLFLALCKESFVVNKHESKSSTSSIMPREKYPKPLIFHDGRLAFLPTPFAMLAMFIWLPFGIFLAFFRLFLGKCLPYNIAALFGAFSGVNVRIKRSISPSYSQTSKKGVLYACTHRTLLDPIFLTAALAKPLTAVTYSLSKISEMLAPIKTVRLTRDRKQDAETMQKLLSEGDLVICPEGTTCREPYLLRFSSLFTELADEIVPVAMNTHVTMFYGTTASGFKWLDPIFFLMNPTPCYNIHILEKVAKEMSCSGGKSSHQVANYIQRQLGLALGFECTTFTRRDKYLMLAGNEGLVQEHRKKP